MFIAFPQLNELSVEKHGGVTHKETVASVLSPRDSARTQVFSIV